MKHRILCVAMALMAIACGNKNNPTGTDAEAPGVPSGVQLKSNTETSLVFTWSAVSGADSYQWRLLQGMTEVKSGKNNETEVTVTGLSEGTAYSFSVRSIGKGGMSAFSSAVSAATASSGVTPPDPTPGTSDIAYADFMIPETEEDGVARAFPGAEGGGMYTTGGRGGKILHVTTLEDSNAEGTLRWACTQNYPRIIVFDVAGIISLNSTLKISANNITIAGQTAPGDGICLKNYPLEIAANNVIVRFIRCRMGDEKAQDNDAMTIMTHTDDLYHSIIIDHCSVSWSTDECASFYGMKDFTFQWNIVSESLRASVHDKGVHGYGGIWGGTNATYHHNLLAHHESRNPRIDHDFVSTQKGPVTIMNNVVYNWTNYTCYGGESANTSGTYRMYNFFNNYYKPGPATPSSKIRLLDPTTSCSNCTGKMGVSTIVPGHFYMTGNVMDGKASISADNWTSTTASSIVIAKIKEENPFSTDYLSIQTAQNAYSAVLAYSGACYARDEVDQRIADETKEGAYHYEGSNMNPKDKDGKSVSKSVKGIIDTQSDVGGWPKYEASAEELDALRDADSDGIPNAIEDAWGLNKSDPKDASEYTLDPDKRYTNLEMYLHYLVKDIVNGGNKKAEYKKL